VDDDAEIRSALVGRFERQSYRVTAAGSAEEALEKAPNARFDAAVLDLQLPGMNGIDLMTRLKEQQPTLEALLLTAHSGVETAVLAMK
jgi:two-component system NtrC family response regulator